MITIKWVGDKKAEDTTRATVQVERRSRERIENSEVYIAKEGALRTGTDGDPQECFPPATRHSLEHHASLHRGHLG